MRKIVVYVKQDHTTESITHTTLRGKQPFDKDVYRQGTSNVTISLSRSLEIDGIE